MHITSASKQAENTYCSPSIPQFHGGLQIQELADAAAPCTLDFTLTTNGRFMATNVEMLCVYSCLIVFDSRMFSRFGNRSMP
jgi:hypothetical protein